MRIIDLGITHFLEAYKIQRDLVDKVALGICEDTLILTEHRPVITIGRKKGSWGNILKSREYLGSLGIEVVDVDRGGDVTYHAPGQLIAYPILRLQDEAKDIHKYLHYLEEVGIHFLGQYGVSSVARPGLRGIWVKGNKIASIGIGVKKWVTYHGLAVNINVDKTGFSLINPCGIKGVEMISLKDILEESLDIDDAKDRLKQSFSALPFMAQSAC